MRKLTVTMLVLMMMSAFSMDWYSNRQKIDAGADHKQLASKDTAWYSYVPDYAFVWSIADERAVYYNVNDFGLEYPVNLHAIDSYLYEPGYTFRYRIYDKDGETLLWESADSTSSEDYYNVNYLDPPMVLKDDFWISVVPGSGGNPPLVSSDITTSDHSYYKQDGVWLPFIAEDERYEWGIDIGLSPYMDEDIHAPLARKLAGVENFQNFDAELSLTVEDKSDVVTPMVSQYSLDGGANWTNFEMNYSSTVKGTYIFTGTIPGQIHGTEAIVKFDMHDVLGNSQWSDEYSVIWSKDIPLLSESFENEFPPAGWDVYSVQGPDSASAGFKKATVAEGAFAKTGSAALTHWDDQGAQDDWAVSPSITLPADNSSTLSLWQTGKWTNYYTFHEILLSSDGGTNWIQIYTGVVSGDGIWENLKFTLGDYTGMDVMVAFHYTGDYSDQWFIDDVEIRYDPDPPLITDIRANEALLPAVGAYLNNDMNISLTLDDFSGVASVTGHYSFDGGTTVNDVSFAKAKGTEIWTGTIPAMSQPAAGYINFDLADLGGASETTDNYGISFVTDEDGPVVYNFSYGAPVFITEDMGLELKFGDESAISAVTGYYSSDNWVNSTTIDMTASKINEYVYTGIIPAETEETFGQVYFDITDVPGNITQSEYYDVKWLDGQVILYDDFDANYDPANWEIPAGSTWGLTETDSYSPTHSMTDSPDGNYGDNLNSALYTKVLDMSTSMGATMFFWGKVDLETGWDYTYLEGTADGGMSWKRVATFNGEGGDWEFYSVDLGAFAYVADAKFRFMLVSDTNTNADGMCIDDVKIASYNKDYSPPLITYNGPDESIVGNGDYVFTAELEDLTGISEAKVVYTVDGGAEMEAVSDPASGTSGIYTFTIPAQSPASNIEYKLVASDATEYLNTSETGTYKVMSGYHLNYTNGIDNIDYLDIIGTDAGATAYAVAKRLTMGPMDPAKDHYKADLVGFTISNYIAADWPSDPLYAHVWENDGGKPGGNLIEPIWMEQGSTLEDPYALTMVDLRDYSHALSGIEGDIFVGFTTAGTKTNVLYEVVSDHTSQTDYVAFNRSWLGTLNNDAIEWALDEANVYHLTGITGEYTYVDAPMMPMGFAVSYNAGDYELSWVENSEADLDHYNVYRGDAAEFTPVTPIGTVLAADPETYTDVAPTGGDADGFFYYKITAVDVDGNESSPSKEIKINPTGLEGNIPLTTELYNNYPNPFNPETTIKFSLAEPSDVKLTVYNTSGEVVSRLVNGSLKSGYHNVQFNASGLVSGLYYFTLQTGDKSFTNKMMLLK